MSAMDEYALFTTASGDEILEEEEYEKLYSAPTEIVALLSVFYGGISIIAIVGNTLVIWVVATTRQMRTVTNMYIANLAFADVIIGMFCIPFQFHAALLQRWTLPDFMCAFCPFVQAVSVNVSVFTLTAIAIDRHRAIINPLRARPTKFISKIIIATIWVTAITFAVPCAVAFRVEELHERIRENDIIFNISRPFCANINLSDDQLRTYRYSLVFMQYLVPFCVVSFVYIQMAVKLWGTKAPGNAQDSRDITLLRNKKKVIKMLIIVVVVFGICWLPLQSYNILYVTIPEINEYRFINIIWFCCDWLAMSNSCYNPFIYGIYNEKFKREFNKRFSVCFCKFHTSFDNQDRTISIHTRASSVRSTYGTASTRIRNNIFGPHASHYGHTSFHQHPNSAISSRSASMKNARNHGKVDYNVVFSGEMKKLHINPKANGIKFDSSSPIVSSQKDDWQHLPEDGIKTVGITKAAMIAESTHSMPDDTIFNARNVPFTSSSCVCEDALGSRTLCDGSCILNEVARVKCGIEMYGDTKTQDTSLDVCLELSECSPLNPREIRPVI